jgi:hypothetical protein
MWCIRFRSVPLVGVDATVVLVQSLADNVETVYITEAAFVGRNRPHFWPFVLTLLSIR